MYFSLMNSSRYHVYHIPRGNITLDGISAYEKRLIYHCCLVILDMYLGSWHCGRIGKLSDIVAWILLLVNIYAWNVAQIIELSTVIMTGISWSTTYHTQSIITRYMKVNMYNCNCNISTVHSFGLSSWGAWDVCNHSVTNSLFHYRQFEGKCRTGYINW